jgi:hypothetical protein
MKNDHSFKLVAALILTGVFIALFSTARAAEPTKPKRTKARSGTFQSSNGNSGTVNSTVSRGGGETTRNTTATNQDGKTATHAFDRTMDKATGTGTVTASSTNFDGATTSRQGTLVRNADGSVTGQGTLTGPKGQVSTYAETTTKTAAGCSTTGTITRANGQTATIDKEVTKTGPGQVSSETTITGANGKTLEKVVATKVNPDGTGTRVVEVTKPDGTTETRTETFTVTPAPKA